MRQEAIHPVLASRARQFLVASAMITVAAGAVAFGYYSLVGGQALPSLGMADAQASDTRTDRIAANAEPKGGAAAQPTALAPGNTISRQAAEWGAKTCLAQIGQVSDFLTTGQSYSALSRKGPTDAQAGIFASTIAGQDKAGLSSISTFVSAPVGDGKCNTAYQTVAAFPDSCDQIHASRFSTFTSKVEMGTASQSWTNGTGAYLHLLSLTEAGCVIVKTEMVF